MIRRALQHAQRSFATVTTAWGHDLKPGDHLHGFTLQRSKVVPELQLKAYQLQHDRTGADYLHIRRDDRNNWFSIGFKTNPPDETGVPHILEHTALCGSEEYPVRDPFFLMMPRTFANFMNAMTSMDNTVYPFATTNKRDFYNLMSVYLDATLHPLLREADFRQEGWRLENNTFKGVVYNEMKGQYSDSNYLYYIRFLNHIFPDAKNSGGEPQKMTDLTYEGLKKFHDRNYHPSNAKIFTYGDLPLADHLSEVDSRLQVFDKREVDNAIMTPINLQAPLYHTVKGPVDPLVDQEMQFKTSTSWIMGDIADPLESTALGILSSYLLDGYGSPFYQGLIEAGLGPDYSMNTGFDFLGRKGIFSVGLNGVKAADVLKVRDAVKATLYDVHRKGFDKTKIKGFLHQKELGQKHKTADFGMIAMNLSLPRWFSGGDPFDMLSWDELAAELKSKLSQGTYLEDLLEKYLLNESSLTLTMEPNGNYAAELLSDEKRRLESIVAEAHGEHEHHLEDRLPGEADCLPTVSVKDIPRQNSKKPVRDSSHGNVKVQWREASTNGLTYFRAINEFILSTELRSLLPLFTESILRLGTKDKTIEQLEDLLKLRTGGLNASYYSTTSPSDTQTTAEGLLFSGYALDSNVPIMYELLQTILQETNFDGPEAESRIRLLLQSSMSSAMDNIASSGHYYARCYAEAGLTPGAFLNEQTGGLTHIQNTFSLAAQDIEDIISKLKTIQSLALSKSSNLRISLTCAPDAVSANENALQKLLLGLKPPASIPRSVDPSPPSSSKTLFALPYQVSYSAVAIPTVPYLDPASPHLQILAEILEPKIHSEVREKGGAYDGSSYVSNLGGVFGFHSYRDPEPHNTVNTVRNAGAWITDGKSSMKLDAAKIAVFKKIDAPESVNEEGMVRFISGVDEEMEQRRREQLLNTTEDDVKLAAQRFLVQGMNQARVVVLGEKQDWANGWDIRSLEM
ncbi:MAG: hypothetical protein Q9167_002599 [Letrouitia subvulpina]